MIWAPILAVPAVLAGAAADVPPPTPAELDAMVAALHAPTGEARLAAAKKLEAAPPSGYDLYVKRLLRPRTLPVATYRSIVFETWAQVPNPEYPNKGEMWMHKPEPPWKPARPVKGQPRLKRPPPHDPEAVDWLGALAALDLDGNPALSTLPDREQARADALEAVALLHAIGATQRVDAVAPIFDFAFTLEGVFRDECGRAARALGPYAVPGLILQQHAQGKNVGKRRRYASWQLDRMDRARPSKVIATAPDDRLRAEILHTYGEVRAVDAVDAVLGQVDSASHPVRREARWAWLRYVTGPPPPPSPMRKRKLEGGREESEAKEDYLNYRELAEIAIRAKIKEIRESDDEPAGSAEELTKELFAFDDKRRAAGWAAQFQAAIARRDAGDLEGAVAGFSTILAHDAFYERRAEMADTFLSLGEQLWAKGDLDRATERLGQGVALAPPSPRSRQAEARIELHLGLKARAAGHLDPAPFRRALELDPTLEPAQKALAELTAHDRRRTWPTVAFATSAGAAAAFGLVLLVRLLLGLRRRSSGEAT